MIWLEGISDKIRSAVYTGYKGDFVIDPEIMKQGKAWSHGTMREIFTFRKRFELILERSAQAERYFILFNDQIT